MPPTRSRRTGSARSTGGRRAAAAASRHAASPSPRRPTQRSTVLQEPVPALMRADRATHQQTSRRTPRVATAGVAEAGEPLREDDVCEDGRTPLPSTGDHPRRTPQAGFLAACLQSRKTLVAIHEVDHFLQFNKFIRRGYRPSRLTPAEAVGSVFLYFHNETVNILSHLFFVAVFVWLMLWPPIPPLFAGLYGTASEADLPGGASPSRAADAAEGAAFWSSSRASTTTEGTFDALGRRTTGEDNNRHERRRRAVDPAATVAGNRASAFVPFGTQETSDTTRGEGSRDKRNVLRTRSRSNPLDASRDGWLSGVIRGTAGLPHQLANGLVDALDVFPGSQRRSQHRREKREAHDVGGDPLYQVFVPVSLGFFFTFALSVIYHTFMPCCSTRRGYQQLLQCDVFGVLTSITGSAYVYFVRGNACVSPTVLTAAVALVSISSVCSLYALILTPLNVSMLGTLAALCGCVSDVAATVVLNAWEWFHGDPLAPPPPHSEGWDAMLLSLFRGRRRFRRRYRATRMRLTCVLRGTPPSTSAGAEEEGGVPSLMRDERARPAAPAAALETDAAQPTLPAHQRAAIALVHCLLHFLCYMLIVVPKASGSGLLSFLGFATSPSFGTAAAVSGYTQGVYYHGLSYLWLFAGGLLNATRQPERLLWAMTRRARAFERRRMELQGEAAVAEARAYNDQSSRDSFPELGIAATTRQGDTRRPTNEGNRQRRRGGAPRSASSSAGGSDESYVPGSTLWSLLLHFFPLLPRDCSWDNLREHLLVWWPAAFCYYFTRYVLSNRELDFVGNSHNLWHLMTGLSALCVMTGAYYDVVEWELMAPQC